MLDSAQQRVGSLSSMFPGINTLIDKISDRQNKELLAKLAKRWEGLCKQLDAFFCLQERVVLSITIACPVGQSIMSSASQ